MRNHRTYVDQALEPGKLIELPAQAARHLVGTLRLRQGDSFVLFNGDGHDYVAELASRAREHVCARVGDRGPEEPPADLRIFIALGLARGERMDMALQKATELGVAGFTPVITERCVVRLDGERAQRRRTHWQGVITSACEQSGRRRVPLLDELTPFERYLQTAEGGLVLSPTAETTVADLPIPDGRINLLSGPEGGLTDTETALAEARGFVPIRLGPRTLRTETAPLAAIAALQALWGDFR